MVKFNRLVKIIISLFFSLALAASLLPASEGIEAAGSGTAADPATAATFAELQAAVTAAPTDGTQYIIEVTDDITQTATISIQGGKNILIRGNTATRTITVM